MTATPIEAQWPVLRRAARTVVVVDVVESVRLIEQDEEGTVRRWQAFVGEVVTRLLPKYGGRLVKSLGDGLMVEFGAVPPAIQCAIDMQSTIAKANQGRATEQWLCLRVGAHAADVIVDDLDIYGSGVNLAARLTTLAGPGEIVVSADVRDLLAPGLDGDIEDLGECRVKHLQKPVRAYRVGAVGPKPIIGPPTGAAASLQPTIAVLPFDCLSAGAGVEVLGDVVADAVIAQLSTAAMTRVISRLSSSLLRGRRATPGEVRATLGATYVLNGSYHLAGSRVVVSAELADARSAEVIWAERITVPMLDPLQADSELVHRIHVGVHTAVMNCEMRRASTLPLPTLESCSLLIGAIALMHRASHTDFEPARLMLEHLIERAPRSPIPRAWLAKWYVLGVTRGWMDDSAVNAKQAIEQTRRALDVDPNCSLALAMEGFVHCHMDKDLDAAGQCYDNALATNPNESLAWLFSGVVHAFKGEGKAAVTASTRAQALSPIDPMRYYYDSLAATSALSDKQYERAIDLARRSLRANRFHSSTLRVLAICHAELGRSKEAGEWVQALMQLEPAFTIRSYINRSPGAHFDTGRAWADALRRAGVPD